MPAAAPISTQFTDIEVGSPDANVGVFLGNVVNSGTIRSTSRDGVQVHDFTAFLGGITNSGTISAGVGGDGIEVIDGLLDGTFAGQIVNTGVISGFHGIVVTSVTLFGNTSTGGSITNTGTISGAIAVELGVQHVSLFDSGEIETTNLTAIKFAGDSGPSTLNTLTLAPGYRHQRRCDGRRQRHSAARRQR